MSRSREVKKESPSKRLRDVYFVLYKKDKQGFKEFEDYYNDKMEKLIQHYKKLIK
jgi:uncharacterized protein YeaO (DUF488 family)